MKLEDLYLVNKEEWLDVIKDKCKKKAKTHFRVWSVVLILFLIFLTMVITLERSRLWTIEDFVYLVTLLLYALVSGWWVLKSHSFLKTIDGLGTPELLLNEFKKYVKDKSIFWTIGQLIFCGWFAGFCYFSSASGIMKVIGWIVVLVSAIVGIYRLISGKYSVDSGDGDITSRLQELIGEE